MEASLRGKLDSAFGRMDRSLQEALAAKAELQALLRATGPAGFRAENWTANKESLLHISTHILYL